MILGRLELNLKVNPTAVESHCFTILHGCEVIRTPNADIVAESFHQHALYPFLTCGNEGRRRLPRREDCLAEILWSNPQADWGTFSLDL